MASLLAPMAVPKRNPRRIVNGGLGGCVQTEPQERYYQRYNERMGLSLSQRALRRKRLPLAVDVNLGDQDLALSTMTPTSTVLHDESNYGDFGNPFTDHRKALQLVEESVVLPSPIEQHEMLRHSPVFVNRPQTPPTPEQTATLPVELPGSILLPSQGFPQANPPITPARNDSQSCNSEGSRRSSTPSLDSSSSTTDSEMDILKNFTSPQRRSGRANTISASRMKETSKPFTAMSVEELMECLPELNMSVVSHSWVPAMEGELKRIKSLLQEAAELRLQSQADLQNFGTDVNSIAVSARDISRTYFDAMQRVRPLADRDAKVINDQLEFTRAELQTALVVAEENKNIISDKDHLIQRLHETVAANARTLGGFIQDHVGSRLDNLHDIRTQEVRQLLEGQHPNATQNGTHTPGPYVRIPEQQYNSYLENLQNTEQKVETYSKIANDQLELIKSQSADLDKRMEGYGECLAMLEKRNDRIVELESKIEAVERELREAKETVAAYNNLKQEHENLGKHCTSLDWTLQSIKNGCEKQIRDRDTEIFTLRQQLGDAVMEVAAHKAEAKTAIQQPESISLTSRFRNPLHLGRNATTHDRKLPINTRRALLGGKLPASQSMLSLNTSQANLVPGKLSTHRDTPSPLSDTTRTSASADSSNGQGSSGGGKWLSGLRLHPPKTSASPISSKIPTIRPRKDSLHKTDQSARATGGGDRPSSTLSIDREKALPSPPVFESQNMHLHAEGEAENENDSHASHASHSPPLPIQVTALTISPHRRRVLSGITEKSFEDATSPDSTTSSDKNMFRSSMAMLERYDELNDEPDTPLSAGEYGSSTSRVAAYGRADEDSPIKSAREGYEHHLRRAGRARRGRGRASRE